MRETRERRKSGRFLIEGLLPVGAAIEEGWEIQTLLYAPELLASEYGQGLVRRFGGRIEAVSKHAFEAVADKINPQGIVAIATQRHLSLSSWAAAGHAAALVHPQDPGNVGTIVRTLEAVGASAVYLLDGGVDPFHPTVVRASMGANFRLPVVEAEFGLFVEWCRRQGVQLIGTSARGSLDYQSVQPRNPWILLLGNEQQGLSAGHKEACEAVVAVPMRGRAGSLNLAVAAGVLLYAYTSSAKA
ncbi:MAG TPA: RNA methyltransferase [Anaerolineales bacterium]|nr:RNA methyltransferase [Anaerolineales bacterium]